MEYGSSTLQSDSYHLSHEGSAWNAKVWYIFTLYYGSSHECCYTEFLYFSWYDFFLNVWQCVMRVHLCGWSPLPHPMFYLLVQSRFVWKMCACRVAHLLVLSVFTKRLVGRMNCWRVFHPLYVKASLSSLQSPAIQCTLLFIFTCCSHWEVPIPVMAKRPTLTSVCWEVFPRCGFTFHVVGASTKPYLIPL